MTKFTTEITNTIEISIMDAYIIAILESLKLSGRLP